ncbi:hypothetical protein [Serratia sp. OPWLW2]|uniref:hypothetical protein n=1 Tax=Serratia sp. OPWLW2 TaxID=1928658 RepID=UPI000C1A0CC8|nr:hypothetical protein [Serratia sp. OPWLW2]PIJ42783.1 hypothetical protein BOM25_13365 [Serratia sp. OPWLW2]
MDSEQRQKIAIKIYEITGVMYDKDDPVFALALINAEVNKILISDLEQKQQNLIDAIVKIPSMIETSLEKLIAGLEEAENSFDELAVKHRSIINNQLDEAKLEIRSAIKNEIIGGMSDEIKNANQQLNLLSRKIASSGSNNIGTRLLMFLGLNVITALLAICLSGYFYYDSLQHQKDVKRIEKRFNEYKNDISQIQKRLPKNVNDKLMETTKEYFKKN